MFEQDKMARLPQLLAEWHDDAAIQLRDMGTQVADLQQALAAAGDVQASTPAEDLAAQFETHLVQLAVRCSHHAPCPLCPCATAVTGHVQLMGITDFPC